MYISIEYLDNNPILFISDHEYERFMYFEEIGKNEGKALSLENITTSINGIACLKNTTCFLSDFENRRILRIHYKHETFGVYKELDD